MRDHIDRIRKALYEFQRHDVEKMLTTGGNDEPPEPPDDGDDPWGGREEPSYNFNDIRDVKRYFQDKTDGMYHLGPARQQWTVWNFDGSFQRGVFTVDGNEKLFPEMARIMAIWDNYFESVAVFVSKHKEYGHRIDDRKLYLIAVDGKSIPPLEMPPSDSPNANPFNDQQWTRRLSGILDQVRKG